MFLDTVNAMFLLLFHNEYYYYYYYYSVEKGNNFTVMAVDRPFVLQHMS
jgi:hypothetical protein